MMAMVQENPANQQDDDYWAEKQAPEDRQLRTYWTHTQYGVMEPREAVEPEDEQEQRDNLELVASGDHVERTT